MSVFKYAKKKEAPVLRWAREGQIDAGPERERILAKNLEVGKKYDYRLKYNKSGSRVGTFVVEENFTVIQSVKLRKIKEKNFTVTQSVKLSKEGEKEFIDVGGKKLIPWYEFDDRYVAYEKFN